MSAPTQVRGDYQQFDLDAAGLVTWFNERVAAKIGALATCNIEEDFLRGRSVLDVGCDHGFWSFMASASGARKVLGLDRGRYVKGVGQVDLVAQNNALARRYPAHHRVQFRSIDLGKQWLQFGQFEVVLAMSMTHHVYAQCGDHNSVAYWLAQHVVPGGLLVWEGPITPDDAVVKKNVPGALIEAYGRLELEESFGPYFTPEAIKPAVHEPTREIWVLRRKADQASLKRGVMRGFPAVATFADGAKGASKAFLRDGSKRLHELAYALGRAPVPGSLNMRLNVPFNWDEDYYRIELLDSTNRADPQAAWAPRWCRLYPVNVGGVCGWAMRFEGERYPADFVEVIGPHQFRDLFGQVAGASLWRT